MLIQHSSVLRADVVKPALIEISVFTQGHYRIEIRASLEAILTGINAQYKNTQDSPNAQAYDELRALSAEKLASQFTLFSEKFSQSLQLKIDNKRIPLNIKQVDIPEPGYTKVPRMSTIIIEGPLQKEARSLSWYYPQSFGDNAVRVRQVDESNEKWFWSAWQWLKNDNVSSNFSLTEVFTQQPLSQVISSYLSAGFDHILPKGLDHIVFILALFLFSIKLRPLFWQVTMFTLAHSLTLSLAMFNIIQLPAAVVEPLIALSIVYIALENIFSKRLKTQRLIVVFLFGLLHGLGFASMLNDFGMPDYAFVAALISFNVGVELGQIAIILLAFFAVAFWFKDKNQYKRYVVIPGSCLISLTGLVWTYQRIVI